ncbi:hypothetical protein Aperf_G00000082581 [Anoplocephala perfoliata]
MTDWGSHIASSAHEAITPLIAWGKHIPTIRSTFKASDLSPFTASLTRIDVQQANLCPLIACLLGIPIPAHSIGKLPLELIDLKPSLKVDLIRENALHALKQLHLWGFLHRILLSFGGIFLGLWPFLDTTFIKVQNILGSTLSGFLVLLVRTLIDWSVPIPTLIHIACWALLVSPPIVALFTRTSTMCERFTALALAFFIPFNLSTVFFLIYAFFGTGNIASINTFDPVSVYCFITVLNPRIMSALIIFKILCPIVVVGAAYALLNCIQSASFNHQKTAVVMIIANFIAVHFFAMLNVDGPWLDIGESIGYYVIALSIGLATVLFSHVGSWMLTPPWLTKPSDIKLS